MTRAELLKHAQQGQTEALADFEDGDLVMRLEEAVNSSDADTLVDLVRTVAASTGINPNTVVEYVRQYEDE